MTEQETVKTEEVAKVNPLERTLDLVVSYASAEELTEKALKNYGKNAKLPGFRKGHVPAAQVRRMYGMQAYDEAINQLVGEAWQKAASEQQHRIALEAAFGLKEEYGYKDLETALIKSYMSVGVKLNHQKAVSLITMLRNKRMIVQENGRKYTFKPDFHY